MIRQEEKEEVKLLVITLRRNESFRVNQMFEFDRKETDGGGRASNMLSEC